MSGASEGLFFGGTVEPEPIRRSDSLVNADGSGFFVADGSDAEGDVSYGGTPACERVNKRVHSDIVDRDDASSLKKGRVQGGRAASSKPIKEEYDSDDNRLYELKTQGYTDDYISGKLVEEGRTRYVPKTIGTRYTKLRNIAEKKEDEKLDDELSDWHVGEDDELDGVLKMAALKYESQMQKLEERKWKEVSSMLADRLKGKKKYTATACKERWDALLDGTALKPIELDSDQEGRKAMREARTSDAIARRAEAKLEVQRAKEAAAAKKKEAREAKEEFHRKRTERKMLKQVEKEENLFMQTEKKQAVDARKAAEKEAAALWKAEIDKILIIREKEEMVYRGLTGKALRRIRRVWSVEDINADVYEEGFEDDGLEDYLLDDGEGIYVDDDADDEDEDQDNMSDLVSDSDEDKFADSEEEIAPVRTVVVQVTPTTLANPRSVMTESELEVKLFERGLARRARHETHPHMVARLAAADAALGTEALSTLLSKYFDKGKGSKLVKALRLQELDAEKSAAGEAGVKSTDLEFKKGYEGYKGKFARLIRDEVEEN